MRNPINIAVSTFNTMNSGSRIRELFGNISITQRQIALTIIIASTVTLIISSSGVFRMIEVQESLKEFDDASTSFSQSVNSREFNQTVEALRDVRTGAISEDMSQAATVLERYQATENSLSQARESVEEITALLRWLFLISVLGEVTGLTLLYM